MSSQVQTFSVRFEPVNNARLKKLCGPCNEHLLEIEKHFNVAIYQNSNVFNIVGMAARAVMDILDSLYKATERATTLSRSNVMQHIRTKQETPPMSDLTIYTRHKKIQPRNQHQVEYITNIFNHDIIFGLGPAGTGKTYLAVACAVQAFERGQVERLVFVRPAVEAGEKLGFLPGDLEEKVLPYLRPIYDALYEMLGFDDAEKLIQKNVIEIAPLAFMRGRTLSNAFIILDEAQNTTIGQMQMFLTRLGYGSTAVVTGDVTQVDLPVGKISGLQHATNIVKDIPGISISLFNAKDSVRHTLVSQIIEAYEKSNNPEKPA